MKPNYDDQIVATELITDAALDTAIEYEKLTNALGNETLAHKMVSKATTKITKSTEDYEQALNDHQPLIDYAQVSNSIVQAMQERHDQIKAETEQAKEQDDKRKKLEDESLKLFPERTGLLKRVNASLDKQAKESESMLKKGALKAFSAGIKGFSSTISDLADSIPVVSGITKASKFVRDTSRDAFNTKQSRLRDEYIKAGSQQPQQGTEPPKTSPEPQPQQESAFTRVIEHGHKQPSTETTEGKLDAIEDRLTEIRDIQAENGKSSGSMFGILFSILGGLGAVIGKVVSGALGALGIKSAIGGLKDAVSRLGNSFKTPKAETKTKTPKGNTPDKKIPQPADKKQPTIDADGKETGKKPTSNPKPSGQGKAESKLKKVGGDAVEKGIKSYAKKKGVMSTVMKLAPRLLGLSNPVGLMVSGGLLAYDVYSYLDQNGYIDAAGEEVKKFFADEEAKEDSPQAKAGEPMQQPTAAEKRPEPTAAGAPTHEHLEKATNKAEQAERTRQAEETAKVTQTIVSKGGSGSAVVSAPTTVITNNTTNVRRNYGFSGGKYQTFTEDGASIVR